MTGEPTNRSERYRLAPKAAEDAQHLNTIDVLLELTCRWAVEAATAVKDPIRRSGDP